jgi:hypothetical protein
MDRLFIIVYEETVAILSLFVLAAVVSLITGAIKTRGLLQTVRTDGSAQSSPERVQLLLLTVGAAYSYIQQVISNSQAQKLPDVPPAWIALLGGSHALYLGRKYWLLYRSGREEK